MEHFQTEHNMERCSFITSSRQQAVLKMLFGDIEEHCTNVPALIIDTDSFQSIITNFISLLFPIKNKSIIFQVLVSIYTDYCNLLL